MAGLPKNRSARDRAVSKPARSSVGVSGSAHPDAAAAGRGLDHHRVADPARPRRPPRATSVTGSLLPAATGTPACSIRFRALILSPICPIADGGGPIQVSPSAMTLAAKAGVLGQEAVAGVDRAGPGAAGGADHGLDVEVAAGGRRRAEQHRLVGFAARTAARRRLRSRPRSPGSPSRARS